MGFVEEKLLVRAAAVRSGTHDKSLQQKRYVIQDAVRFGKEMLSEISRNREKLTLVELAGVVSWTTVIVTDIIEDTVTVEPTGRAKLVMDILKKVKGKLPDKFEGNRYGKELERIDQAAKVLKAASPKKLQSVVDVFANLAKNTYGLADFMQSSGELKAANAQQKKTLEDSLRKMIGKLREIDARIADDALSDDGQGNGGPVVRQSMQPPRAVLP